MGLPFKYSASANGYGILTIILSFVCALIGVFIIGYTLDRTVTGFEMVRVEGGRAFCLGLPVLASIMVLGLAPFPLAAVWILSLRFSKPRWFCADHVLALILIVPALPFIFAGVHLWTAIASETVSGSLKPFLHG